MINLRIALLNLLQHQRRSFLLGGAIAGVTMLLVLLNGLSAGVNHAMIHTATTLSTGHVNIGGFFKITSGQSGAVITDLESLRRVVKDNVPELAFMVERGRGWAKIISDTGSMQAGISGVNIAQEPEFKQVLQLVAGNLDDLAQPNTILLFEGQLAKLGATRVGDAVTISAQTSRGTANTIDCRVVAVAKDIGLLSKWNTFIPAETLRRLYQLRDDATGAIHIHLREDAIAHSAEIAGRLRLALEKAGHRMMEPDPRAFWMKFQSVNREAWTGQKLDVTIWEDELSFVTWTTSLLQGLSFVLILILVTIVVTGIMNTMWIAIRERTREIGALRAMGMQRSSVLQMFLLESLMLGLGSTLAGATAGWLIGAAINQAEIQVPLSAQLFLMSDHLTLLIVPRSALSSVLLITAITGLAALYPSLRAARLRPVEAMSRFG